VGKQEQAEKVQQVTSATSQVTFSKKIAVLVK
jgi:hypothetical protein